jgi:hypothetical protein
LCLRHFPQHPGPRTIRPQIDYLFHRTNQPFNLDLYIDAVTANSQSKNVFKVILLTTIAFIASFSVTTAWAQGSNGITAQAFAIFYGTHITGSRANVWTAQQPANWWAIASPVAVCTTQPNCTGYVVETGFVKGTVTTQAPNVLQQFVSWRGLGIPASMDFVGTLQDNTWYEFRVEQCGLGTTNWCAYIFKQQSRSYVY